MSGWYINTLIWLSKKRKGEEEEEKTKKSVTVLISYDKKGGCWDVADFQFTAVMDLMAPYDEATNVVFQPPLTMSQRDTILNIKQPNHSEWNRSSYLWLLDFINMSFLTHFL